MMTSTTVAASSSDKNTVPDMLPVQVTQSEAPRTLRNVLFQLPAEIRCMIYERLVAHRVIDVLDTNRNFMADGIGLLLISEKNQRDSLAADIGTWMESQKYLRVDAEMGIFDPETAIFSATFAHVPYKRGNGGRHDMDELSLKDAIAWDKFSSSKFLIQNVRQIRIDLHRHVIFTGRQNCLEGFKTDLRSIAKFRNLERIDIHCDTHKYLHEQWQGREDEPEWSIVHADAHLRRIWRNFWRFGGWCHPGRVCTGCVRPEIRLQGYGTEWQVLDFEQEIPETLLEQMATYDRHARMDLVQCFEERFGRTVAGMQRWLQQEIKRNQHRHSLYAKRKAKLERTERAKRIILTRSRTK